MIGFVVTLRRTLGILSVLSIAGLLALAIDLFVWDVNAGGFIPAHLVFGIIYLVGAILVATGWQWAPASSGVVGGIIALLFFRYSQGFLQYYLAHPADRPAFAIAFVYLVLSVLVLGVGVATLSPAQRRDRTYTPPWLPLAVSVLGGIVVGGLLISFLAATPTATPAPVAANGSVPVHATLGTFSPNIVALHAGGTLTIIADTSVHHNLLNGTWNGNHPMPEREANAPVVNNVSLSGNTIAIGPFMTAGTYHIYCTIHPGMALTIVVV